MTLRLLNNDIYCKFAQLRTISVNNNSDTPKLIDIEKVISSKNPKLLKWMPKFILNYIRRTIHEDEINYVVHTYGKDYDGLDFVNAVITQHWHASYDVTGLDDIPQNGRYIFASNHPLGAFDGLMLMNAIGNRFLEIKFIVNDLLLLIPPLQPLFVPVNKYGRQSADYAKRIEETYASLTKQVLYFPSGLCSRKIHGEITDLPWKRNFLQKAVQYQRDVVPVYFDGHNSRFFYNIASFRKKLGIKANIEMFYLPDEFFKQKNAHYAINFGKPISWETFDKSRSLDEWTQFVRSKVYAMSGKKD